MTLATALQTTRSSLANAAIQSALISRNVASAGQAGYARRIADLVNDPVAEGVGVAVRRIAEDALRNAALDADSRAQGAQTTLDGLDRIDAVIGAQSGDDSLAALFGRLKDSLTQYANEPARVAFGEAAMRAAGGVARELNRMSQAATELRSGADADIADSVANVNELLARFKAANDAVVGAVGTGRNASDAQDERDAILAELSKEIGVAARPQRNGGLALYADGGLTLFDREPRRVEFRTSGPLVSGAQGASVMIDGVDATSAGSTMRVTTGRIAALFALRDEAGVALQAQADETALALVEGFAESDQRAAPSAPTLAGLFVDRLEPGVPAEATGLAMRLAVNANADPAQGGEATRLRDGGVSDPGNPAYLYNAAGVSGYSDRLRALAGALDAPASFSSESGVAGATSLADAASASAAWLAGARRSASADATRETAVRDRTVESLSNARGVNVDEELSRLLDVERAYQASAKLLTTLDDMFGSLLQAVG
ncbi:MAG: flagellar hook-associated protein FlgK [Rhizobiales bacterium]|nr:flagellar hook-associated protein FlgK [Hyphomicrobiales bacterium]